MLNVDREKAEAMGVSFDEINQTITVATGSSYVNDIPIMPGSTGDRSGGCASPYATEQLLTLSVKNRSGRDAFGGVCDALWNVARSAQSLSDIRPSALGAPPRASPRVAQ
ncbi:MAG: hypothetical protein ACLR17_01875 [Enterobacteriaceae bacterium]